MPELPEVETTRRGLAPHLIGHKILRVDVHEPRLRWRVADSLAGELRNQTIRAVERRAKYLLLALDHGTLIWHLGMSGSLDHVDLRLDTGWLLRFNDPRRFGCCIYTPESAVLHPLLRRLAPEPFDAGFNAHYLHRITRRRRVAIKQLLLNGTLVTGVGNIYASEALFRSRIRPGRAAHRLTRAECARLVRAIRSVLRMAIRAGGTTLRDYVNAEGAPGYFRQKLYVYEPFNLLLRPMPSIAASRTAVLNTHPVMARLVKAAGRYTLQPKLERPAFESLARSIAHQQLSGVVAAKIMERFCALYAPAAFPSPRELLETSAAALRATGFSFAKIRALHDLAGKSAAGVVPANSELATLDNETIIERLTTVRGIGRWTVEMMLMFQLGRPDVLPVTDFGVQNGFRLAYGLRALPLPSALARFGQRWAPHRTAAAWYLWRAVDLDREGRLASAPRPAPRVKQQRRRKLR